jgi:hypothetical protein
MFGLTLRLHFFLVGGVCLAGGVVLLFRRVRLLFRSTQAKGRLVSYLTIVTNDDFKREMFLPVISFESAEGKRHEFTSRAGYGRKLFPEGHEVRVRYTPAHPEDAFIDSFLHFWAGPTVFLLIGIVAVGVALKG